MPIFTDYIIMKGRYLLPQFKDIRRSFTTVLLLTLLLKSTDTDLENLVIFTYENENRLSDLVKKNFACSEMISIFLQFIYLDWFLYFLILSMLFPGFTEHCSSGIRSGVCKPEFECPYYKRIEGILTDNRVSIHESISDHYST